jgi:hypothetical protein
MLILLKDDYCDNIHFYKPISAEELARLTSKVFGIKYIPQAEVAELADALGSGLSGRKLVRVQVPPSALLI